MHQDKPCSLATTQAIAVYRKGTGNLDQASESNTGARDDIGHKPTWQVGAVMKLTVAPA